MLSEGAESIILAVCGKHHFMSYRHVIACQPRQIGFEESKSFCPTTFYAEIKYNHIMSLLGGPFLLIVKYLCREHTFYLRKFVEWLRHYWSMSEWNLVYCGNLGVLPLGLTFVYTTLFGTVKNTNLEFRSEKKKYSTPKLHRHVSTTNSNLLTKVGGCSDVRASHKTRSANTANPQTAGKG